MAQLPPKVPSIVPHHHHHQQQQQQYHQEEWEEFMYPQQNDDQGRNQNQNPAWVDEFIEFSAGRRGFHRRTASESSVAFVEAGITGRNDENKEKEEFDKFDDEQFLSMFSNELGGGGSTSTSEHNSVNEDQRNTTTMTTTRRRRRDKVAEEVESKCKVEKDEGILLVQQGQGGGNNGVVGGGGGGGDNVGCSGNNVDGVNAGGNNNISDVDHDQLQPVVDPKRVKRILANRQSAQRSRVRKLQYISELERSVTALQSEVSALSPRVAFLDHQRMILNVDNSTLKAKIAAFAQDKIFKDAHQEAMKREIERLRQVYYQQNLNKPESMVPPSSASPLVPTTQPPPPDTMVSENEQRAG